MKCLILAAGYATRMYPLTKNFPKPLLEVGGKPIIDWLVEDVEGCPEIMEIAVLTNAKYYAQFQAWAKVAQHHKAITVLNDGSTDNENRLGAVRDIQFALEQTGPAADWLILAGDNVLDFSLHGFVKFYIDKQKPCIMCYTEPVLEKQRRTGIITMDASMRVTSFEEKPAAPKSDLAVPPFYLYRSQDVARIPQALADSCKADAPGGLAAWLFAREAIYAYSMPGKRYDIGNMESYQAIQQTYNGIVR